MLQIVRRVIVVYFSGDRPPCGIFALSPMKAQHTAEENSLPWKAMELRQALFAKCAASAMLVWMFLPVLTGRVYVCDDLLNYHLPIRQFYSQCLANGDSFDWLPSLFCGFFLTGSGQAGTYHPLHYFLYRCLPLETAFNLEILVSYPFMLIGMSLFLRRRLKRIDAAWLGAIVFTFSGFCTLHFLHPNAVAVVAHIPWLLLAQDVLLRPDASSRKWSIPAEVGIALLTGSQLLLGYPQYVWYSLLAEVSLCLALAERNWTGVKTLTLMSLLKCFGLLLGAVQLLPSMAALAESERSLMPPEFFFQHPLSLADMLQWIGPFLTKSRVFGANTHELGVYCGALPVLLALTLIRRKQSDTGNRLIIPMVALGLLALWLSFGRAGGFYTVQTWLPLIGKFRYPSRIVVLLHLVLAVLAATGYARLMKDVESGSVRIPQLIMIVPWMSAVAAAGVWWLGDPQNVAPLHLIFLGPALFFLAALMIRDLSRGRISTALMLFVAGDLFAYGFTYEPLQKTQTWSEVMASLHQPPGTPTEGRIVAEIQFADGDIGYTGNDLLLAGWRQADGYEGLLPLTNLFEQNTSLKTLRIAGVRWINAGGNHSDIAGLKETNDPRWLEVPNPLPRARLAVTTVTVANPQEAVRRLQPDGATVVERDCGLPPVSDAAPGSAEIQIDRPGQIQIQTLVVSPQLLVLSERFSSGWTVTIDGVVAPIARAEVDFMGCVVPGGTHTVQFRFDPISVRNGRLISGIALMFLCLYIVGRMVVGKVQQRTISTA